MSKLEEALLIQSSRMKLLEEVMGGLAHEINNPLSIIMSRAAQLERKSARGDLDAETLAHGLKRIEDLCERISQTVKANRMLARDPLKDPEEDAELGHIVAGALHGCEKQLNGHGIQIESSFDPKLVVHGKPMLYTQVLFELLRNAHDSLLPLTSDSKWVRISSGGGGNGDFVLLKVTDSGPSIPPEVAAHLMEPLFTTKRTTGSAGIGLAVGKARLQTQGGDLLFDGEAKEPTFVMKIPRSKSK